MFARSVHGDERLMRVDSASISCHPSFMTLPDDFKNICKPISIAVGTKVRSHPLALLSPPYSTSVY